jgi:hypothetical protein
LSLPSGVLHRAIHPERPSNLQSGQPETGAAFAVQISIPEPRNHSRHALLLIYKECGNSDIYPDPEPKFQVRAFRGAGWMYPLESSDAPSAQK